MIDFDGEEALVVKESKGSNNNAIGVNRIKEFGRFDEINFEEVVEGIKNEWILIRVKAINPTMIALIPHQISVPP